MGAKAKRKKPSPIVDPKLEPYIELFDSFKRGTRVSTLAKNTGMKRSKLRRAFTQLAGGKEGYREIMSGFAPVVPPGSTGPRGPKPKPDDSAVRWIRSDRERKRWEVWNSEAHGSVFIEPDTEEFYRAADEYEVADLIIPLPHAPEWRLVHDPLLEVHRPEYEQWWAQIQRARAIKRGENPPPPPEVLEKQEQKRAKRKARRSKRAKVITPKAKSKPKSKSKRTFTRRKR